MVRNTLVFWIVIVMSVTQWRTQIHWCPHQTICFRFPPLWKQRHVCYKSYENLMRSYSNSNNNGPNGHLFYVGGDLMMRRGMLPIIIPRCCVIYTISYQWNISSCWRHDMVHKLFATYTYQTGVNTIRNTICNTMYSRNQGLYAIWYIHPKRILNSNLHGPPFTNMV